MAMAVPTRDPAHLSRLWGDRLERLDPGFGFDLITLTAEAVEPLAAAQDRLDGGADGTLAIGDRGHGRHRDGGGDDGGPLGATGRDLRQLETEFRTRANYVQLERWNGDVLALSSMPSFDPNSFSDGIGVSEYKWLSQNDHVPLRNKVLKGLYPPGSTVKPMVAMAFLEAGLDPSASVGCGGGLLAGCALAARALSPNCKVIGVEPEGAPVGRVDGHRVVGRAGGGELSHTGKHRGGQRQVAAGARRRGGLTVTTAPRRPAASTPATRRRSASPSRPASAAAP